MGFWWLFVATLCFVGIMDAGLKGNQKQLKFCAIFLFSATPFAASILYNELKEHHTGQPHDISLNGRVWLTAILFATFVSVFF